MAPGKADQYILGRGYKARVRLNLQHYNWQNATGFLIHPSVPQLSEDACVLDVGTGTGVWLTELARKLPPSNTLIGADIDISGCPQKGHLPKNVSFREYDIFEDPPADLVGKVDVIHIRLLVFVIRNNDPVPVIQNMAKLLKPGGWIQWEELDPPQRRIVKADPSISSEAFEEMDRLIRSIDPKRTIPTWVKTLDKAFEQQGLDAVQLELYEPRREDHYCAADTIIMGWEEMIARDPDPERAKTMIDLIPKCAEEVEAGVSQSTVRVIVIGRRN